MRLAQSTLTPWGRRTEERASIATASSQTFLELVAIDSPTGHEEEIGKDLEARFEELGCTVSRDEIGNVFAVRPGTRDGTILVSTHMDTAGTDRGIVPIIGDDGVIRTDGSTILGADDKSGIAGCLELLTLLNTHPDWAHPTIEFVVTVGEERGLVGSRTHGHQPTQRNPRLRP